MKKEKVYYAHSKQIYDTKREREELAFLRENFEVLCPNSDIGELVDISFYLNIVRNCDRVVCSEYKRHIGKGVYEELQTALLNNKKIDVLRKKNKNYVLKSVIDTYIVDSDDWRTRYAKVKCNNLKKEYK